MYYNIIKQIFTYDLQDKKGSGLGEETKRRDNDQIRFHAMR